MLFEAIRNSTDDDNFRVDELGRGRRRGRSEKGNSSTIVEYAFIISIIVLLLAGAFALRDKL